MTDCNGVFFVGTDTSVGKTHFACLLAGVLVSQGVRVGAYKPVESGCSLPPSDSQLLHAAAQLKCEHSRVCPQSFDAAAAPPIAAAMEGRTVDRQMLMDGLDWWKDRCDFLIVEGAGGALSPISSGMNVLDFASNVCFPIVLVAANRLGMVNHTMLSLEAIANRGLGALAVLLNDVGNHLDHDDSRESNAELLRSLTNVPIVDSVFSLMDLLPDLSRVRGIGKQNIV